MKKIVVILLSTLILAVSVKEITVFVSFKINQSFIALNQCINRGTPEMKCHGKCQLTKVLKENKQQKEKYPATNIEFKQITLYLGSSEKIDLPPDNVVRTPFVEYKDNYPHLFIAEFFHPPQVLSLHT